MPKQRDKKGIEKSVKKFKTKEVFHFIDTEKKINRISKEVFATKDIIVHYPFYANNGKQKYNKIEKIIYEDIPDPLPSGFLKNVNTGYGFTKELAPLLYLLQDKYPNVDTVLVSLTKQSDINGNEVVFNLTDLANARPQIKGLQDRHKSEVESAAQNLLADYIPASFTKIQTAYAKGQLKQFMSSFKVKSANLSKEDLDEIVKIISTLPKDHDLIKTKKILATKAKLDKVFIEDIIDQYKVLLKQKSDTKRLEGKWQDFFRENILHLNFGYLERFEKNRIQGDISDDIPDFILANTYNYLDVFEIKTHVTQLLSYDTGRKNFYWTSNASQAIIQAENYIDSIIKNEYKLSKNIIDEYGLNVDAVRPTVYIVASSYDWLAGENTRAKYKGLLWRKVRNDFRRLTNSLKNIKFILYDELLLTFENTLKKLTN